MPLQAFIVQRIGRKIADLEIQVRFLVEAHLAYDQPRF